MPLESWGWLEPTGKWMAATKSPCNWGKRTGEGFLPHGAARETGGAGTIPVWGARNTLQVAPWRLSLPVPLSRWPGPRYRR